MSSSKKVPSRATAKVSSDLPDFLVFDYCERLKVSNSSIYESAKDSYDKVSVSKWYRAQIPAAIAVASIFDACRGRTNFGLISLAQRLKIPVEQVVHALWVVEATNALNNVYRPSPKIAYEPPSSDRKKCYSIVNENGVAELKDIKLSWSWPKILDFTLESPYDTQSPHLIETYNRVSREIEAIDKIVAEQQPSKTIHLEEEIQPQKAARRSRKPEPLKGLVITDAASKKDRVLQSKKTIELIEDVQPIMATNSTKKPALLKNRAKPDAPGKDDPVSHSRNTIEWIEEVRPASATNSFKKVEPVPNAARKKNFQQPKKTIPLVPEIDPFAAGTTTKSDPYLGNLISKEVKKAEATTNPPPGSVTTREEHKNKASKKRADTKKTKSTKNAEKDEDGEWDIIDTTDDDEKDKDWVEISGRDLMAEKNEPMGWKASVKRWFG